MASYEKFHKYRTLIWIFVIIILCIVYLLTPSEKVTYIPELGEITRKEMPNTIVVEGYGKFLLTDEQFKDAEVGKQADKDILKRGN